MRQAQLTTPTGPVYWVGVEEWPAADSYLPHYVLLPPQASLAQPAPVVVMIHGWGGDEGAMWVFKRVIPAGVAVITPRAPLSLAEGGYVWYPRNELYPQPAPDSLEDGLNRLRRFLADLPHAYPIDPARLVLIGFSQGAAMVNSLVIARPGFAIGVASLAGLVPESVFQTAAADSLAGLPVLIAHGQRDETIAVRYARQAREVYTRLGAQVTYGEYHTGHKMTLSAITALKHWLEWVIGD